MITENLSTLKIHKLTQEQYDRELEAGNIDASALYLTPEEEIDLTPYATKAEVEELKTSVSEGKALIASAVTDMGVQTADDATFATISTNIKSISSDATATASDIAKDKTAYVNGELVTGVVKKYSGGIWADGTPTTDDTRGIGIVSKVDDSGEENGVMLPYNCEVKTFTHASNFGNATAADVVAGKTFTSAAGLKVTGTGSAGKIVANIVDFYSCMQNEYIQTVVLDKPIKNIESVWLNQMRFSSDDPNSDSTIPPDDYYDNGYSYEFGQIFYDKNTNIKGIMTGGLSSDSGNYDTDSCTITGATQSSPSVINFELSDNGGSIDRYFPSDVDYTGNAERWYGYVIGDSTNENTYYMKNISHAQSNSFECVDSNRYVQYNSATRKWNICRLYFNFVTSSTISLNFQISDIDYGQYLIIGNLNESLNDDRYVDDSYYFCSDKITSNYSNTINYNIPAGESYIDIKVCSNTSTKIDAMTYFTVTI